MKRTMMMILAGLLAACGGKPSHRHDGAKPGPSDGSYLLDAAGLAPNDALRVARWTVRVSVADAEKARVADVDYEAMALALRGVSVRSGDLVTVSITIKDAAGKILATNAAADAAAADAGAQAIWAKECKDTVSDQFALRAGVNAVFNDKDSTVGIRVSLCDFDGLLLQGAIRLEPAQEALKRHEIIFACEAHEDPYWAAGRGASPAIYPVFYALKENTCRAGYRKPADAAPAEALVLEAPAGDATATAAFKANDWDSVRLLADEHDRVKAENIEKFSAIDALPAFVRSTGTCNTVEFVRHYLPDGASQPKEARVFLDRASADGAMAWRVRDADKLPFKRNVTDSYAAGATIAFYVHCTWYSPPNADVKPVAIGAN